MKKVLATLLTCGLLIGSLAGCGEKASVAPAPETKTETTVTESTEAAPEATSSDRPADHVTLKM